jgi:serine/threonine protein kinase
LAVLVTPGAGDRIANRYLLEESLGRGGMGVVWRALDERLWRRVAVKFARPDDDRAAQRLMEEARNAGRLHHPNIVGVFDYDNEGETCWIVMEYVPGRSLARILADRGPLTPEEAGAIGSQIADALAKSHAEGVAHGDVTPENILVTDEGVARLTDFGISRALWSDVTMVTQNTTAAVRGKPRYLAPEVAKGKRAGKEADVFSLGATLYGATYGWASAVISGTRVGRRLRHDAADWHRPYPASQAFRALPGPGRGWGRARGKTESRGTRRSSMPKPAGPPAVPRRSIHALGSSSVMKRPRIVAHRSAPAR